MVRDGQVTVVTRDEVAEQVRDALARVGVTFEELDAQAQQGRFESDEARRVWLAVRNVAIAA
jgi:hypothetical protein